MTPRSGGPLRADARRNRDRILAAAADAFSSTGPDTPVEEIATAAGVGVGTLYRHFPDRDALIRGVGLANLARAVAETRAAAAEEPTAWDALVRILGQSQHLRLSLQLALASPSARAVLAGDPEAAQLKRAMLTVLDDVVQAAQAEGALRPDIGSGDVAMVFVLLVRQVALPRIESAPLASQRCLALMLDALRGDVRPLPGAPLTRTDLGL